ncbi:MFS transporter [Rummeliibacillus stabekisii]|uniref:MFS transporter n=1 Tax=Rummeliibacillus stabekisii TaxID=241244 RepID=UPI001170B778|nr:MFS transporter [Rummeliibacillus stabekisii]MBB5170919.1 MFS family permease [Rummeliibacillus stabekisii]GEL05427.1 putative MFS-type transporter YuxJ [Rummeliibacillus stabekisii]
MNPKQKHNFIIMWISNMLVSGTTTMIMPFLSLYINTLGNFTEAYVQKWSGLIFGSTFITAFLMSPIWGRIADRFGYKPILIINGIGLSVSIFFMGHVQNVEQFFFLRLAMGVVTGFIPTSLAFISSQTPKESAGKILGTLQMGSVTGSLFGPIVGGLLADSFGFKYTFYITSASIATATLLVITLVHEIRKKRKVNAVHYTQLEVLRGITKHRLLFNVMLITALIQIGNFSIQPLLSLYVSELTTTTAQLTFLSGLTFSATGLGNLLFARIWGRLGDHIGYEKVMLMLLLIAVVFMVPQAMVTALWQLVILRFLYGIAMGGLIPATTALIRREAPVVVQGEVMGYNTSFRFLGNIIGPVFGGIVSGIFGISSVFYVTGALFVIAWFTLHFARKKAVQHLEDILEQK